MTIGFIGQGYIGKNYADDFEQRGFSVIRYSLEEEYKGNKERIQKCEVVFIAVPTPTTSMHFDASLIGEQLSILSPKTIAVIKSTILPGTTEMFQAEFPELIILHSPEFLSKATAALDAQKPFANVVGTATQDEAAIKAAETVLSLLPNAPHSLMCTSKEAELIKYIHNVHGYWEVVLFNVMYDSAQALGADWEKIQSVLEVDPFIPERYVSPVHKSGRGAGGFCFIKDFAAFRDFFEKMAHDEIGADLLRSIEKKNLQLLKGSQKDLDVLEIVYGDNNPQ